MYVSGSPYNGYRVIGPSPRIRSVTGSDRVHDGLRPCVPNTVL